jgi:hypothetical protein
MATSHNDFDGEGVMGFVKKIRTLFIELVIGFFSHVIRIGYIFFATKEDTS